MSFMINPLPYDDMSAINRFKLPNELTDAIMTDQEDIASLVMNKLKEVESGLVVVDGYMGARFEAFLTLVKEVNARLVDASTLYKTEAEIDELIAESLPKNYVEDPAQIYGKMFAGNFDEFFDASKVEAFLTSINQTQELVILWGHGSAISSIRQAAKKVIYLDMTPKEAALQLSQGDYKNIGASTRKELGVVARRYYFVDGQISLRQRKELLDQQAIDLYCLTNKENQFECMDLATLQAIADALANRPFRAKPIYLSGVWGGEFLKKARGLQKDIDGNVAWAFEFIPLESSIAVELDGNYLDLPFYTFLNSQSNKILGERINDAFNGFFPVRFNYDDTWHSNGNMSVQVHPGEAFIKEHYNDLGGQHEAYYIVNAGHDAKTYIGWKKDGKEFLEMCKDSEINATELPYQDYVHAVDSKPGMQVMIPAGSVHASGRNQLVFELGSLTTGAYTYKIYDYLRKDANGKLRPIHNVCAEQVLAFDRDPQWVNEHAIREPKLINETESYTEHLIGYNDEIYYETYRIDIATGGSYQGYNDEDLTVVALLDGEAIEVRSTEDKDLSYDANYLDVITIPASINSYEIVNKGNQPVVVHKTRIRK